MRKRILHIALALLVLLTGGKSLAQTPAKKEYRLAMLLPFKTSGYRGNVGEAMMDYYEGFSIALRQLEQEGFNARVYVFDSEKDSLGLETALEHPDLPTMDVIIGPVYEEGLRKTEAFCAKHRILHISPLKYYKPAGHQAATINFFAPDSVRVAAVVQEAYRMFPKHRFYIITDGSAAAKPNAVMMKRACQQLKMSNYKTLNLAAGKLTPAITRTDSIVLLCAIPTMTAKTTLMTQIKTKRESWLMAHHEWHSELKSMAGVDESKVIYPEMTVVTPSDTMTGHFSDEFNDLYYADPSKYAYIGYDQAKYIGYGLMAFGDSFWQNTLGLNYRGFINHIRLEKCNGEILNCGLHMIRILDGKREEFEP